MSHLLRLRLGQTPAVCAGPVSRQVNLVPERRRQHVVSTLPLLAQEVVVHEVHPQRAHVGKEILLAIVLAEVAPVVLLPQVHVESVVVQISLTTELAVRVSPVRCVLRVPLPPVHGKLGPSVHLELGWEQLEVVHADVTEVKVVCLADMLPELAEVSEGPEGGAELALVVQHGAEGLVESSVAEVYLVPPVHLTPVLVRDVLERGQF